MVLTKRFFFKLCFFYWIFVSCLNNASHNIFSRGFINLKRPITEKWECWTKMLVEYGLHCKINIFVQFGYQNVLTTFKMCLLKRFIFSKMHFEWNINLFKDKFNKNSCINSSHFAHILWYSKFEFQPSFQSLLTWHCLAVKVWWTVESISDWKPPFYNFEIAMLF